MARALSNQTAGACWQPFCGSAAWRPRAGIGVCAGVGNGVANDEPVPDEQHDERADGRGDKARALVDPIPADGLADEGCQKGACDAEHGGQNETTRIIWSWRKQPRNDPGDEANHDDPDEARHDNLPCALWTRRSALLSELSIRACCSALKPL